MNKPLYVPSIVFQVNACELSRDIKRIYNIDFNVAVAIEGRTFEYYVIPDHTLYRPELANPIEIQETLEAILGYMASDGYLTEGNYSIKFDD